MSHKHSTVDTAMHCPDFPFRTEKFIPSTAKMLLVAHPQLFGIDPAKESHFTRSCPLPKVALIQKLADTCV